MVVLTEIWSALPKEVQFIFGVSVFLYAGSTILQAVIFIYNLLVVNATNLINGCAENPAVCIPAQEGIFIFGINFADYWTITALIFFPILILFAIKWYSMVLKHD